MTMRKLGLNLCTVRRCVMFYTICIRRKCKDASDPEVDAGVQVVHVKLGLRALVMIYSALKYKYEM